MLKTAILRFLNCTEVLLFIGLNHYSDYYPFGMIVPSRHGSAESYRYGFNGKELDNELKGEGNSINYEARMQDTRVGRFLSIDPLFKAFAWFSPYQFAGNSPISCVDLDGLEMYFAADGSFLGQIKKGGTEIRIATKYTPYKANKNGKIDEGFLISKSMPINQFSFATQGKVYQTIYDREVGGEAKILVDINYHRKNQEDEPILPGTGAHTLLPLGKGAIVINANFHEDTQVNGKFIKGIGNGDYYSAAANSKHEEKYFKGLGEDIWTDHFQVWVETYQEMKVDGTYSKLSIIYKEYLDNVDGGYIEEMARSLNNPEYATSKDFDGGYDMYVNHVKEYNK
nr:RHS repeat-associated core domain-containing protein [uncultured Flavobacterium sp.]